MRKKITALLFLLIGVGTITQAQTNIFPTDGNVGIGTTSPSEKLHLQNGKLLINNGSQYIKSELSSSADYSRFMFNGTDNYLISYGINHNSEAHKIALKANHGSGSIGFFTNSTERLSVDPAGNVGIGSITPSKLLHLKIDDWQQVVFDRTENVDVDDLFYIGPSFSNEGNGSNDGLRFSSTTENTILFLGGNGNIGIGTRDLAKKLTVNGTAKAEEVIVEENVGADFVFKENYNLPTLFDLEKYIEAHKHLPEIPSAEEMKKNGVQVGALQMKLLQKIEELTLHSISQEKKIKHLEKENSNLQKLQNQLLKQQKQIEQLKQQINAN